MYIESKMDLMYTQQIDTLLQSLSQTIEKGEPPNFASDLRAFSEEYTATYECPDFWCMMKRHLGYEPQQRSTQAEQPSIPSHR